jgi:hypothetical protein
VFAVCPPLSSQHHVSEASLHFASCHLAVEEFLATQLHFLQMTLSSPYSRITFTRHGYLRTHITQFKLAPNLNPKACITTLPYY